MGGPIDAFWDQTRSCGTCGKDDIFSAEEQRFWHETLGFFVESVPIQCQECLSTRRQESCSICRDREYGARLAITGTATIFMAHPGHCLGFKTMGWFRSVLCDLTCVRCGTVQEQHVQFKTEDDDSAMPFYQEGDVVPDLVAGEYERQLTPR
ncbi:zinc-ribbon domain containing protein [bacterium]|nr:zinc-ribbon domain containing protein [bacterium]